MILKSLPTSKQNLICDTGNRNLLNTVYDLRFNLGLWFFQINVSHCNFQLQHQLLLVVVREPYRICNDWKHGYEIPQARNISVICVSYCLKKIFKLIWIQLLMFWLTEIRAGCNLKLSLRKQDEFCKKLLFVVASYIIVTYKQLKIVENREIRYGQHRVIDYLEFGF